MVPRKLPLCASAIAAFALAGCSPQAPAQAPAAQAPEAAASDAPPEGGHADSLVPTLSCGPESMLKAGDTTASLVAAHGQENVKVAKAPWVDSEVDSLVLFPDNPAMTAELLWLEEPDRRPSAARVSGGPESLWVGPEGLLLGATLADVEAANGGPFLMTAFGNHNHGEVSNFLGGKLQTAPGAPCRLSLSMAAGPASPDAAVARLNGDSDTTFRSDSPDLRAANPVVAEIVISFFK